MQLDDLLGQAVGSPSHVKPNERGAALLALGLHCMMVEHGFVALGLRGGTQGSGKLYRPPADWNNGHYEWIFYYARKGMANRFRLHIAFQPATGRVFCHASELTWTDEAPLVGNIVTLGLQLEKYVPDPAAAATKADWTGVIVNQAQLVRFFREHVLTPLYQRAERSPRGSDSLPPDAATEALPPSPTTLDQYVQQGWARVSAVARRREARAALMAVGVAAAAVGVAVVALRARAAARPQS
ncbi:hypothetical protein N2152v2_010976 [Parachlorella kessleri]